VSETVRIYIDAKPVDVARGSHLIDALASASANDADHVRGGSRMLTDSRGLPAMPDAEVYAGAIYRLVRARSAEQSPETE